MALSPSDFQAYDWESAATSPDDFGAPLGGAANRYYREADRLRSGGDERGFAVFELLGHVCSLHLRPDSADEPFTPSVAWAQSRSAALADLTREDIAVLEGVFPIATNASLRARIADVVWTERRNPGAARVAVEAYLEVAAPLRTDTGEWPTLLPGLERALRIQIQLGEASGDSGTVIEFISGAIDYHSQNEPGFFLSKLFELLLEVGGGDAKRYLAVCQRIAEVAEASDDWHRARVYWEYASKWANRGKDPDAGRQAIRRMAEAFVLQAEQLLKTPNAAYIVAASHLQSAITVLRRVGGNRSRVDELHARLLKYQEEAAKQLIPYTSRADITEFAEESRKAVGGKDFLTALLLFGFRTRLPVATRLREQAEENAKKYMFSRLFPKRFLGPSGKTISIPGSMDSNDPEEREAAVRADMFDLARFHFQFMAGADIWPMKSVIAREHPLRLEDFAQLLETNVLIPPGRAGLWAEGIRAGFVGDMPKAIHVLIPQLEHALRHLLERTGMLVSSLDKDGIQKELNLNNLLYREHGAKLTELLGEDMVFAMQALLVEKAGADMRNRTAHGMVEEGEFYGAFSLCTWWLISHFALLPIRKAILPNDGDPVASESAEADDGKSSDAER